jgi:hypothetical protein
MIMEYFLIQRGELGFLIRVKALTMEFLLTQRRARELREASEAASAVQREAELTERLKQVRASQQEKQRAEAERKAQQVRLTGSLERVCYCAEVSISSK